MLIFVNIYRMQVLAMEGTIMMILVNMFMLKAPLDLQLPHMCT